MTKYEVKTTSRFQKEYKLLQKRGKDMSPLKKTVALLADGIPLPPRNDDHALIGNYVGHRECHIAPDWLLIYRIDKDILVLTLTRTGSHNDLF